ncbi:MAG TPA: GMC family oxidoreductase [Candidatus Desulfobacillus sp.]|nr:GMC family oxidoreductase [Candidatus Desulfobacillus sp.]
MSVRDPIAEGLRAGWQVVDASRLEADREFEADVAIVGSGAGGGIAAEVLTKAGLKVVIVEEGPLKSSTDFRMRESDAYPQLYQESAARKTRDKAINILQGRCVGGSTTVNWTSSFRTPPTTLAHWQGEYGLKELTAEALAPWFEAVERRLGIHEWQQQPNENNALLRRAGEALGIPISVMRRNVRGCWDLGYCGMGCPTNAKQSMLLTTLPAALAGGAVLAHHLRAERLVLHDAGAEFLECAAMQAGGIRPLPHRVRIRARHFVLAAGAIGTPALLLRSRAPDPHGLLGRRTFLHPTTVAAAVMDHAVAGHAGAPQSAYSDHFLDNVAVDGPIGYKLEVPPIHPVLFATTLHGFGEAHRQLMTEFDNTHAMLALLRDGFHPDSPGGSVSLRDDGTPLLDYPISDFVWDGVRRSWLTMAELQFAAGARRVYVIHEQCAGYASLAEARRGIAELPLAPALARVVSAHVMGGCAMAADDLPGVTDGWGRHRQLGNVSVCDGSLFPTSIGANPQETIYGLAARNASRLAEELSGRPAPALA